MTVSERSPVASVVDRARALYGLSRGTQAVLSIAQPLVAALLADGSPSPGRLALATVGGLAGFLAVFATNDLMDAGVDGRRFATHLRADTGPDIDSAGARHPLAQGLLTRRLALGWIAGLSVLALVIGALLNPVCVLLFLLAALLEVVYCRLATVTPYKFLLSGVMVAVGASAGWFAFRTSVDPLPLGLFVLWMFAWEIGGRNIPNDLADVAEDVRLGIRTVPVVYGARPAVWLAGGFLLVAFAASGVLMVVAWPVFGVVGLVGTLAVGVLTLLRPALLLVRDPGAALPAFNLATFHPVGVLAALVAALLLR
ncbi:UbiA prenyltransferase family protein [Streptomyces alkaliterrae]|uniref:UbiA prenyltransferase family protein n=1 Tax=Streptomyces alkaliterrae TaxID=2213162 RepID=UPI002B21A7AD|nr:UbiA prenyltransferase family protein [Streptomyces alkaliterrae]